MSKSIVDVIIVGAGPAGSSLAVQLKKFSLDACLIDKKGYAGGLIENAYSVNNYLGLEPTKGNVFAQKIRDTLQRFNIGIIKANVLTVEKKDNSVFVVKTDDGTFSSRAVALAVGTLPVEYNGVAFYELGSLVSSITFEKSDRILIIGGGESAFDYSLSLSDMKKDVTICIRGEHSKVYGVLKKEVESRKDINIKYNCGPDEVEKLASEKTLILSAIGRRSALCNIEITADHNEPGLFIIGDAKDGSLGQVGMAVGDGIRTATEILKTIKFGVKCENNILNA